MGRAIVDHTKRVDREALEERDLPRALQGTTQDVEGDFGRMQYVLQRNTNTRVELLEAEIKLRSTKLPSTVHNEANELHLRTEARKHLDNAQTRREINKEKYNLYRGCVEVEEEARRTREATQHEIERVLELLNESKLFDPPLSLTECTKPKIDIFLRALNEGLLLESQRGYCIALSLGVPVKRAKILDLEEQLSRTELLRLVTNPRKPQARPKRKYVDYLPYARFNQTFQQKIRPSPLCKSI